MSRALVDLAWPVERLGEALASLGGGANPPLAPAALTGDDARQRWLDAVAAAQGLEAEAVRVRVAELDAALATCAPALIEIAARSFLVVTASRARGVEVLTPEHARIAVPRAEIADALRAALDASAQHQVEAWLARARAPGSQDARLQQALRRGLTADDAVTGITLLRPAPAPGVRALVRQARLAGLGAGAVLAQLGALLAFLWAWVLLGNAFLGGRIASEWLVAFGLALATLLALRVAYAFAVGELALRAGIALRTRLFVGATRLDAQSVKHEGTGLLLGRVLEADQLEAALPLGALLSIGAALELAVGVFVVAAGSGGLGHAALLLAVALLVVELGRRTARRRSELAEERLRLSADLVEAMVGHRTRLAQLAPSHWHAGEDAALARSLDAARRLDRVLAWLRAAPRLWLPLFVVGLAPGFVGGTVDTAAMAFAVGGALLGLRALRGLAEGVERLGVAQVAAMRLAPLLRAAARQAPLGRPELAAFTADQPPGTPLLAVRQLVHGYPGRAQPALRGLDLEVRAGERVLVGGASGGGKSTLARILAGAQVPDGGLVLLAGYDRATLGAGAWRHGVVLVPQFHEDHVLLGSFAFNVLLGRGGLGGEHELALVAQLCDELGLADVLARMPSGLHQTVGETGWQLSHGERARVCLARALVQRPALLILDESFAALDPATFERVMRCVLARQPTLLAIAHP